MPDSEQRQGFCFEQIHIDAARNATDDFNPFHDPYKWQRIRANPFGAPIALGFQLEALIEYLITRYREQRGEAELIQQHDLRFANFQFTFADVVRPGETIQVDIKKTTNKLQTRGGQIFNRVSIRKRNGLVLLGFQRETKTPLVLVNADFSHLGDLGEVADRTYVGEGWFFLKRKFLNTGHGKNFLSGSLADQHYYFDELEDRVRFPAMFPVALLSCALLEQARHAGYDLEGNPVVYTGHKVSVDRSLLASVKSNDRLHMLVHGPQELRSEHGLKGSGVQQHVYQCFGLLADNQVLYRAEITTAPLQQLIPTLSGRPKP